MNTSIPDSLREFVLTRVAAGGYASVEDYIGGLVKADRAALERLEAEIERGLTSRPVAVTADDFERLREEIRRRHAGAAAERR